MRKAKKDREREGKSENERKRERVRERGKLSRPKGTKIEGSGLGKAVCHMDLLGLLTCLCLWKLIACYICCKLS